MAEVAGRFIARADCVLEIRTLGDLEDGLNNGSIVDLYPARLRPGEGVRDGRQLMGNDQPPFLPDLGGRRDG